MFYTEITFYSGSDREFTYEKNFATLQESVDWLNHNASGMGASTRAWINNKEVKIRNCIAVGDDGEPFCTNDGWHRTFGHGSYGEKKLSAMNEVSKGIL